MRSIPVDDAVVLPRKLFLQLLVEYSTGIYEVEKKIKRHDKAGRKAAALLWRLRLDKMLQYVKEIEDILGKSRKELMEEAIAEFLCQEPQWGSK